MMILSKSTFAVLGFWLALVCLIMAALSPLGYRLGWWDFRVALLTILKWAALGAALAFVLSLIGALLTRPGSQRAGFALALAGLILSAPIAAYPIYLYSKAKRLPQIHDISTDTVNAPKFVALAAVREAAPNGLAYKGAEIAQQQRAAYPEIVPLDSPVPADQLFARAEEVVREQGWEIAAIAPREGRIEATYTSLFFGFKDDIVIRVEPHGSGSRLDMRSMSRVGRSDVGANAARIRCFIDSLAAKQ